MKINSYSEMRILILVLLLYVFKKFWNKENFYEKLLRMCVVHVYVHLAHDTTIGYLLSVVICQGLCLFILLSYQRNDKIII